VDRVVALDPGKRLVAVKNVTMNEPFFVGHFPGNPVMPGVLILEALAQAGGLLAIHGRAYDKNTFLLFAGIDKARFRSPVVPGDTLTLTLEVLRLRKSMAQMKGVATVGDRVAAEAEILSMIGQAPEPSDAAKAWMSREE
jgi:3-hydroxyacyl-[acyl-carrier-protein] dehydratase